MACRFLYLQENRARNSRQAVADDTLSMSNTELIKEFRINCEEIEEICELVKDEMQPVGHRMMDLSLKQKVLLCLKTLGSGSFQSTSKDFLKVAQPTVSKVLTQFVNSITTEASRCIYTPRSREEVAKKKHDFYQLAGFAGVIGCIDGSHIPIVAPQEDEFVFINRKGFHSINIQAVCNSNLFFRDVVARWPGSHHNSFIMEVSSLRNRFANNEFGDSCWLLVDSGYSLKKWLITPFGTPISAGKKKLICCTEKHVV